MSPYFHRWWRWIAPRLDGAIAVSPMVAADLKALFPPLHVEVVRPFVMPELRERLLLEAPKLAGSCVLHTADRTRKNGTALLVQAWPAVRKGAPGAQLHLVGRDSGDWHCPEQGIVAHGFVPDITPHLAGADLFALPGLGQAYTVSTLEAMTAGVPALVSDLTGAAELVAQADSDLVVAPEPPTIAKAIVSYLNRPVSDRRDLGERCRRLASALTSERQTAEFTAALDRIMGMT